MKKISMWILCAILVVVGGLVGRALVVFSMTGYFGLTKPNNSNTNFVYTDTNFEWAKISLPFPLEEDLKNARQLQNMINATAHAQVIQDVKWYAGTYDKNKFYFNIQLATYAPTVSVNLLNVLGGAIAGAGFATEAQRAMQQAQPIQENESTKYIYHAESKLNNTPAVFVAAVCAKGNQIVTLFANGNNTPTNKDIIEHILSSTVCFPKKTN